MSQSTSNNSPILMKWLHLSDIHYSLTAEGVFATQARKSLIDYIKAHHISAEYLFITGDFRHAPENLISDELVTQIRAFILDIATAAKVASENIHYVAGNHDVILFTKKEAETLDDIRQQYRSSHGHFDNLSFLISENRYAFYNKLCDSLAEKGVTNHCPTEDLHSVHHHDDFDLICLNTSLFYKDRSTDPDKLLIGTTYFIKCIEQCNPDKALFIIAHHPLDQLDDAERSVIERRLEPFRHVYYLCGDTHRPNPTLYAYDLVELMAGSITYDAFAALVFYEGELNHHGISMLKAHSWMRNRWAVFTQLNEELSEKLKLDRPIKKFLTKHESRAYSHAPEHFVGRSKEIADIETQLSERRNFIVLVNGIGGMGKTEICRFLMHRYITEQRPYAKYLAWITFTGDLKISFFEQFYDISAKTSDDYWAAAQRLINGYGRDLLLVIDNANELSADDQKLLKQLECHLLLTSRSRYAGMKNISLGELSETECVTLYRSHSGNEQASDEDIFRLINLVDRHTLAIELLAKTQKKARLAIKKIIRKFESSNELLPADELVDRQEKARYIDHIVKIFDISTLQTNGEALHILKLFSQMKASMPLQPDDARELLVISNFDCVNELCKTGWLQDHNGSYDISIHPLISAAIRYKQPIPDTELSELISRMSDLLLIRDGEEFIIKSSLLPHVERLLHYSKIREIEEDSNVVQACQRSALIYAEMANYDKAIEYYDKALNIYKSVINEDNDFTASVYENIATVYRDQGNYEHSQYFFKIALRIKLEVLGKDHHGMATIYNNIHALYADMGKLGLAYKYCKKALILREKYLGEDNYLTVTSYQNIAALYADFGRNDLALDFYFKVLEKVKETLGVKHSLTATVYNNIASVYSKQGLSHFNKEAKKYYQMALSIREDRLGAEHKDVGVSYVNMGSICTDLNEHDEALIYYLKAKYVLEKILGQNHPNTADCYHNIGIFYQHKKDYENALVYYEKALIIRKRVLGEAHYNTAIVYHNMGTVFTLQGLDAAANEKFELALSLFRKEFGMNHQQTCNTQAWINRLKKKSATRCYVFIIIFLIGSAVGVICAI